MIVLRLCILFLLAFGAVGVGAALDWALRFHRAGLARLRTFNAHQSTGRLVQLRRSPNYGRSGDPAA